MAGVDTLVVEAAILNIQAYDGETDAEATLVCTKWTINPTGVASCAVFLDGDD